MAQRMGRGQQQNLERKIKRNHGNKLVNRKGKKQKQKIKPKS